MENWDWWNKAPEPKYQGLFNHGATCYLNSVLQVLFMTKEFREAINRFTSPSEEHIDRHLKELFDELLQRRAYTYNILKSLEVSNVYVQQDAAEYFEKILRKTSGKAAQIFHGQMTHRTICLKCKTETDSEGPFWHLPLDLEGGENYSVENGIKMFFTPTIFDGENQMYCDNCDDKVDADRRYVITHHPDVLLLLLKRFDFSYEYMSYIKINCNADVPHILEIPESHTYELYAVVEHSGDLRGGHYIATIKSKDEEGEWYIFNDTSVTPLGQNPFPDNVNVVQSRDAYLLFYKNKSSDVKDPCSLKDPNLWKTRESDQSQTEANHLEEDDTEKPDENIFQEYDSAKNDCNIKETAEKGEPNGSKEIRAVEKEIISQNESSSAKIKTKEQTDSNKQKERRREDETSYSSQVIKLEDAGREKQVEHKCLLSTKNRVQCNTAGKTEPMKSGNIQAGISHDNPKKNGIHHVSEKQQNLKEAHRLPEERTDEDELIKDRRKHNKGNINTKHITSEDTDNEEGKNKYPTKESLVHDDEKSLEINDDVQPDIISNNTQAISSAPKEQERLSEPQGVNKVKNQTAGQKRNKRAGDAFITQTQETVNEDQAHFHQDTPKIGESEETNTKDDQKAENSCRSKKDQVIKENMKSTNKIGNYLFSQSKDKHKKPEGESQPRKSLKHKATHSDSTDEAAEDLKNGQSGQNQGAERGEEIRQISKSGREGRLDQKTIDIDVWEVSPSGKRKKTIQIKTTVEEIKHGNIKRWEKDNKGNLKEESDNSERFRARAEMATPCEPLLLKQQNPTSNEVPRGVNEDAYRMNISPDVELETLPKSHVVPRKKKSS